MTNHKKNTDELNNWPQTLNGQQMQELLAHFFSCNKASNFISLMAFMLQRSVEHPDKLDPTHTSSLIADIADISMFISDMETIYHLQVPID